MAGPFPETLHTKQRAQGLERAYGCRTSLQADPLQDFTSLPAKPPLKMSESRWHAPLGALVGPRAKWRAAHPRGRAHLVPKVVTPF